jgi:hypothetical protein
MKKPIKKLLSYSLAAFTALQCLTVGPTASAEEGTLPPYEKVSSFSAGVQGKDGWYYMYKDTSTGEYVNMTWNGSQFDGIGGGNVNTHFIMPGYEVPSVIGFEVPYTGTVTLRVTHDVIYRSSANAEGGDVIATLKLNNDELWTHTFENTCNYTTGTSVYVIENVSVKKGDMIYHEVDCGINNSYADIYWKPIVKYTAVSDPDYNKVTEFKMVDDIKASDQQGYNGWYYMYQTSTGYVNMETRLGDAGGQWQQGGNFINCVQSCPGWKTPTVIGWQAPYSGTVTISNNERLFRLAAYPNGGDVTAKILHNSEQLKQNDETEAKWVFAKTDEDGNHDENYRITDVNVNAGDWIYHIIDCGEYNGASALHWQPNITYTAIAPRINGAGTAEDPYIITSITDYKVFADKVNGGENTACAKLASDIVWNSNTPQLTGFAGTIDGDGHKFTLRGKSLIKSAADGAVIKNLIVDGAVSGAEKVGAIVEQTPGNGAVITIANSASLASVKATNDYSAGFVGYVSGTDTVNMSNCYGYGTVNSIGAKADPFACADGDTVCNNCYYLTGGTTNNNGAVAPSVSGVKQSECKTFAILSNGVVFGYAQEDGKLIIADYIGSALNAVTCSQDVDSDTFIRTAFTAGEGTNKVKAFVWNNFENMKPACDAYVLNIE